MKDGPIIFIEDDLDDQSIFEDVIKELGLNNELVFFAHPREAFKYLKTTPEQPFIIFSDVNLPSQNGIELKRTIDDDPELRKKSIPFIFYSTSVNQRAVNEAYTKMTVQGFFLKGNSYTEIKKDLSCIFNYWNNCKHPNTK